MMPQIDATWKEKTLQGENRHSHCIVEAAVDFFDNQATRLLDGVATRFISTVERILVDPNLLFCQIVKENFCDFYMGALFFFLLSQQSLCVRYANFPIVL